MLDPRRIIVATTFEDTQSLTMETEILFRTLARYGGQLAGARRIACSVGPPDPFVAEVLEDLGVELRVTERFDERCPHANKLAMLELVDESTDLLLALDTDVAIAGDPLPWLTADAVLAKPVDVETVSVGVWQQLFDTRGVRMPAARYLTAFTAATTIAYFNSGVLGVPAHLCRPLHEAWATEVRWLLDEGYDVLPSAFAERRFFTDQFALALALARLELPVRALPIECNFPTNHPLHPVLRPEERRPLLLHHHHRLQSDGQLLACDHAGANAAIERVNEELRREPDAPLPGQAEFDNRAFWNERYRTNMALGSGIGSRGEVAERKRALLQQLIDETAPRSILDVGCGDLEIVRRLRFDAAYTGVDIAEVVVERNRELAPEWRFLHGEFTVLAARERLEAELVLCLDVLIHQHDAAAFDEFVRALVHATTGEGVVAAYERPPTGGNASAITAYHGPITERLRAHGAQDVTVVDEYRGTAVVRYRAADDRGATS